MEKEQIETQERPTFFTKMKSFFTISSGDDTHFQRRLLDGRIERYLDENFNNYIEEYGLVREIDLKKYEERFEEAGERIANMKEFIKELDADVASLEHRLDNVKNAAGGSSKGSKRTK